MCDEEKFISCALQREDNFFEAQDDGCASES
jgi:hypothetical protein